MTQDVAIIGAGPAGLMAAERLSAAGLAVTIFERMPTAGRKFLLAGRGGLNLTHAEDFESFTGRYGAASSWLRPVLDRFTPAELRAWAEGLGIATFVGSSGRVFPRTLKASPLLRAWLARLAAQGVRTHYRHRWLGWDEAGALSFATPDGGRMTAAPAATLLALGGASWPKLGSDGAWTEILADRDVALRPLVPANCGFEVAWTDYFRERFHGQPVKTVALSFEGAVARGDAMVTTAGIEGGPVYTLSAALRDAIAARGPVTLDIDLRPDIGADLLAKRLGRGGPSQSLSTRLRKTLALSPLDVALLREAHGTRLSADPATLAAQVKSLPVRLIAARPIDRAISSAGGIMLGAVDQGMMLTACPGVFVAGEMLDWEAPTGGYLLQACVASGIAAAEGMKRRLGVP